jgi:hypothetical protein
LSLKRKKERQREVVTQKEILVEQETEGVSGRVLTGSSTEALVSDIPTKTRSSVDCVLLGYDDAQSDT